jgi:hypothetical protein
MVKKRKSDSFARWGKSMRLGMNVFKGHTGEKLKELQWSLEGKSFRRTGKGHDYEVTDRYGRKKYVEVKTGDAKPSKLQRRTSRRLGKKYSVERVEY